ncbi:MAG: response regulator, partial [Pseudomonadota bacterium]
MSAYRILVIDDDQEVRSSLVELIEAAGWSARPLARAVEAERWIHQFSPDVILSDLRMPEMTGLELLEQLHAKAAPPV